MDPVLANGWRSKICNFFLDKANRREQPVMSAEGVPALSKRARSEVPCPALPKKGMQNPHV